MLKFTTLKIFLQLLFTTCVFANLVDTNGCGITKGCFRWPNSCQSSHDCLQLVTFTLKGTSPDVLVIELASRSNGWVAFGLNSEGRKMGGTKGHVCMMEGAIPKLVGFENEGTETKLKQLSLNVKVSGAELINGSLICRFERPLTSSGYLRPLTSKWHLVGAWGPSVRVKGSEIELREHATEDVFWTRDAFDLREKVDFTSSTFRWKTILAHAACMTLAWVLFATLGMFFARYTRRDINRKELMGNKLWFQVHRILMVAATLFTIIGIVIIFSEVRGWSMEAGLHPYIGLLVTLISIFQPIGALLRPSINSPRRHIFEWGHWGAAIVAAVVSLITMFTGLGMTHASVYMLSIFAAGVFTMIFIIEAYRIAATRIAIQVELDDHRSLQVEQTNPPVTFLPILRMVGLVVVSLLAIITSIVVICNVHSSVQNYIDKEEGKAL